MWFVVLLFSGWACLRCVAALGEVESLEWMVDQSPEIGGYAVVSVTVVDAPEAKGYGRASVELKRVESLRGEPTELVLGDYGLTAVPGNCPKAGGRMLCFFTRDEDRSPDLAHLIYLDAPAPVGEHRAYSVVHRSLLDGSAILRVVAERLRKPGAPGADPRKHLFEMEGSRGYQDGISPGSHLLVPRDLWEVVNGRLFLFPEWVE